MMRWIAFVVACGVAGLGLFLTFTYFDRSILSAQADVTTLVESARGLLSLLVLLGIMLTLTLSTLAFVLIAFRQHARVYAYGLTKEIAQTTDQLRKFYEFSPVPYLLVDPRGRVCRPNKASLRLFGVDEEHLVGTQLFDYLSNPLDARSVQMYREQVQRGAGLEQKELQVRTAQGEVRWVLFSAGSMPRNGTDSERMTLVSLVDIHEQKELERIKTEFLSLASHQLRAPLANLKWYIDFLLTRRAQELTDGVKTYLLQMFKRNEEMIDLVNTLLNLSRVEMGRLRVEMREDDIVLVLQSILEELAPVFREKTITITTDMPDRFNLVTDAKLVRIVIQNLLTNAARYTPAQGTVTLRVEKRENEAIFAVSDTGIGIPSEEQGRIFTKMYRASNAQQVEVNGNGIGLYMCKAFAEALGGGISFTSLEGKGTTFRVVLPTQTMQDIV
ncbi:MAG: PAS domain S-box protein [Candidatus Pacebacteria bacterium]|nr:PAS domain S-box protein [Candidatus Paceibacterota bacterium]